MGGRRTFTVALIGADGAGKTTVARAVEKRLAGRVRYLYMGVGLGSSNRMLPTTRLVEALRRSRSGRRPSPKGGPGQGSAQQPARATLVRRTARGIKSTVRLANRFAEEWYRQSLTWYQQARGSIVLFDRHFYIDYYVTDIAPVRGRGSGGSVEAPVGDDGPRTADREPGTAGPPERTLHRRLHGLMLEHLYPKPNLVIYLDAPPDVLFSRKGEGSLESLAARRAEFRSLADRFPAFVVVDATQSLETVIGEVIGQLEAYARSGRPAPARG